MPRSIKGKQRILEAAAALFYKNGYKATGVDAVAKASAVTKATIYHHFSNKDALIEAVLLHLSEFHKSNYTKAWNKKGLTSHQRLTILFDAMAGFFKQEECYGCPFINAAGEYTERDSPVRKICEAHYQFIRQHLEQFARDANLKSPRLVAEKITSAIAGSYAGWYVAGIQNAAKQGKLIAETIIKSHQQ